MKKTILITLLLCALTSFAQENKEITPQTDEFLSNLSKLSSKELMDKAMFYYNKSSFDTTLIYCNLIINTTPKNADIEQQTILFQAYNRLASVYGIMADYRLAYDNFIKALNIGEKYNLTDHIPSIYNNIGLIYLRLNNLELASYYYLKSIELIKDSSENILILNNLGSLCIRRGEMDSAYYFLNKLINISKENENKYMQYILNNIAECYKKEKQYDSAFYYFRQSIEFSKINNDIRIETVSLSDIGKLFFEINKIDSALYYIDLSNKIASENKFLDIITNNYLILSEIEKSKGRYKTALELYETFTNLKDSLTNAGVYGSINLLQRQYEVAKTNQHIEELIIDRQIKENTIHYQRIIQRIIASIMLLAILVLLIFILQNRKLRTAYKVLYDKNIEIIRIDKKSTGKKQEITAPANSNGNDNEELMSIILKIMGDTKTYCDPSFTVDKLVTIAKSNHTYVYNAIKSSPNKTFPKLLNSYRIKEAQRIFMEEFDTKKYTIETVGEKVGFKSRSGFYDAFKQITGVSPNYYIKSMKEEKVKIEEKIETPKGKE